MAVASGVVTGMEQQSWGCGAGALGRGGVWVLESDLGAVLTTIFSSRVASGRCLIF